MSEVTLDSSALLAALNDERGADRVFEFIDQGECAMSSVNLSEVLTKLLERHVPLAEARTSIGRYALRLHPFDEQGAFDAALLSGSTRAAGLSLGDRACIALAARLGTPVVTADQAWTAVSLPVEVILIR